MKIMGPLLAVSFFAGIGMAADFDAQVTHGYADSNGVKIHYLVEGKGEPVLLIHGFAANVPVQWGLPGLINALARDETCAIRSSRCRTARCRTSPRRGRGRDP